MGKHDGVDQNGPTDTDGPASNTETVTLGTQITGEDLGGDQECNGTYLMSACVGYIEPPLLLTPSGRVNQIEQEKHGHCRRSDARCFGRVVTRDFVERGGLFTV